MFDYMSLFNMFDFTKNLTINYEFDKLVYRHL